LLDVEMRSVSEMLPPISPHSWRMNAWDSPSAKQTTPAVPTGGGKKKKKKQKQKSNGTARAGAGASSGASAERCCPGSNRRGGGTRGARGGKNARQIRKHFNAQGWAGPAPGLHKDAARSPGSVRDKPTWRIPIGNARDNASNVKVGMWNCFGLTTERMDYLFGSQDKTHEGIFSATSKENWLCCLVECRRGEQKIAELWNSKRLIVGGEAPDNDKAAGTAIVLSPGLVNAVQDQGCYPPGVGCRIVWVQLATRLGIPLIVIAVYIPHHGRTNPCADDVYGELRELMAILPERSIKVVVGDLNGRLARAYDFTGKKRVLKEHDNVETEVSGCWSVHRSDNEMGGKIRDFLIEESMVAASTYFHPQRKVGGAKTYEPFGDAGKGRKGAGLDYACISERYQSSCTSVEIKWGPSEYRFGSGNGVQKDHAMLVMNLRLRVAKG
jgi:hypothetical protein